MLNLNLVKCSRRKSPRSTFDFWHYLFHSPAHYTSPWTERCSTCIAAYTSRRFTLATKGAPFQHPFFDTNDEAHLWDPARVSLASQNLYVGGVSIRARRTAARRPRASCCRHGGLMMQKAIPDWVCRNGHVRRGGEKMFSFPLFLGGCSRFVFWRR